MSSYENRRAAELMLGNLPLETPELVELRDIAYDWLTCAPGCGAAKCSVCDELATDAKRFARLLCDIEAS